MRRRRRMLAAMEGECWGGDGDCRCGKEPAPCCGTKKGLRQGQCAVAGSASLAVIPKAAALAVLLLVVAAAWIPGADASTCDTSCKCVDPDIENQDPVVYGQTCIDQGSCGNLPCTGGTGCPSSAPSSITAMVTGDSTLGIYWEDPTDYTMVDQYNIYFSMTEAASACDALSEDDVCSFTLPEENFARTGVCGVYNGGTSKYCWIDLAVQIAAIPPCDQQAPAVQGGCNWANLASGVVVGRHFFFRINAGRCCYGAYLFTPGCTACTDPDQSLKCPLSPDYAYSDIVALATPSEVRNVSIGVSGPGEVALDWALPADTGSTTSNVDDLTKVRITRSTASDFSANIVVTDLANTALTFSDTGLTPGVVYYYKIETGNTACGASSDVCGDSAATSITAVGVPSAPTSFATALTADSPGEFALSWAAPSDSGQGNGSPSSAEVITEYQVLVDGTVVVSQAGTTFQLTGLTVGQSYVIAVRANNQAGNGALSSLTRTGTGVPSAPLSFTATVSTVDGPLKIRLEWATPSDTGQGNTDAPLKGYKVLLASSNEVQSGAAWTSDFATFTTPFEESCANTAACTTSTVLTFNAARATPYVMRVIAKNEIGYGDFAEAFEQAVDLPGIPLNLTAAVSAANEITLTWDLPPDTGVGDQSRPLNSVFVERAYGSPDLTCTTTCASCSGACITSQIGACCSVTLAAASTTVTITDVPAAETRYYFRVKGGNDVGLGDYSNIASEQGVARPSAPQSLSTSFPEKLAMDFQWSEPSDTGVGPCTTDCRPILAYVVLVVDNQGVTILSETVSPSVTNRSLTGLSHSKTYDIQVWATNVVGIGLTAAELTDERPRDVPTRPASFTSLVGTSSYQILFSWGTPSDTGATGTSEPILEYIMEIDTVDDTFAEANILRICGTGASCTAPLVSCVCNALSATITLNARRATPYYIRIQATNQYGASAFAVTNQYSVGIPSAPQNLGAAVVGVRSINISWTAPTDNGLGIGAPRDLDSYILQRSYNSAGFAGCALGVDTNDDCADGVTTGACCTISGVSTDTYAYIWVVPTAGVSPFYFRVFAKNEVGIGVASTSANEQGVDAPSAPQSLDVQTIGPAQFTVNWASPLNTGVGGTVRPLLSYTLQVIDDPNTDFDGELYFSVDLDPTVNTFTKTDFIGGTNYTFRVLATNIAGLGVPSETIKVPAIALSSPPQTFTAVVSTPLEIALAWVLPADTGFGDQTTAPIREYRLNVSTSNWTSDGDELASGDDSFLSYTHTGLTKGVGYYYRVQARTDAGWGDFADAFEEGVALPSEAFNVSVNITSPLKIGVVWELPANTGTVNRDRPLTAFRLEIIQSATELSSWTTATTTLALALSTTSYLHENLIKGYWYYFRLVATNDAGEGSPSLFAFERGLTVPARPTGLSVTIIGPLVFVVSWSAPTDTGLGIGVVPSRLLEDEAFLLEASTDAAFTSPVQYVLSNATFTYTFEGLTKAQRYYYRAFASNIAGTSVASLSADKLAIDLPFAPQNPSLAVSTDNERELILTWEVPADTGSGDTFTSLTNYRLQEEEGASPVSTSFNITITNPGISVQTVTRSSLNKGSDYYYRIFASNAAGEGEASSVVFEMAIDRPSAPISPSLVVAGSLELLLTWSPPTDTGNGVGADPARPLTQYEVRVDGTSDAMTSVFLPTATISPFQTNYTRDPSLMEKGRYYYMHIIAYNSAGASPASVVVSEAAIAAPTPPLNLVAIVSNPLEIAVSWSMPSNTGGIGQDIALVTYRLMRASTSTFADEVAIQEDLNTSRLEVDLAKGGNFYYRVFAVNQAGQGDASNTAFEQGVDLPSAPAGFSISHQGELSLKVEWQMPVDTGLGNRDRPLLRYVLESENVFTGTNGTFPNTPFSGSGECFLSNTTSPCDPTQVSPHQVQLVPDSLTTSYQQSALIKGNTHYYRVRAVNSAGGGPFTSIVFEQALVLPSGVKDIGVTLVQVNGVPAYEVVWIKPDETGSGQTAMGQPVLSNLPGHARTGTLYEAQAAINAAWSQPDVSLGTSLNLTAYKLNPTPGVIYHFRVSAINEVGRGPWTAGATSGPQVKTVFPKAGGARGGIWVTVTGNRFGASQANIKAWIGDTRCDPVVMLTEDEAFRCLSAPGTGGFKKLTISVIGLEDALSQAFEYLPPLVTGVSPGLIEADGGEAVTITGVNFGAVDMTPRASLIARGSEACSTTLWSSDSSVMCWVGPATPASQEESGISVLVDGQESGPDGKVTLVRTGLEAFLQSCPSQATPECFDCSVRACYAQRVSAAEASGAAVGGDTLDECELAAASHCRLDASLA